MSESKKFDPVQSIQILANLGVLAGIVFLGVELSQNNRLMEDEARRARTLSVEQTWTTIAENDGLARLFVKDRDGEELDEVEGLRIRSYWMRALTDLELAWLELPDQELQGTLERYRQNFEFFPSLADAWERNAYSFREDFVQWLDENVETSPP